MRWAVLLAGGSGTRFWPLSTPDTPKQVLRLAGTRSSAEEAVARLAGLIEPERILLVTGRRLAGPLQKQLGLADGNVLVEPAARSTAPALVWACVELARRDPDATVLSMHADWYVPDAIGFRRVADAALTTAERAEVLVTVGVVPTRPESGYGYIVPDSSTGAAFPVPVRQFIEKPRPDRAAQLIQAGALWNSGLFAWRARTLIAETRAAAPEVAVALAHLERGDVEGYFRDVADVSIDVAVLERSARVVVLPGDFVWDDIGNWEALSRIRDLDAFGNTSVGPVTLVDATDNIVWTDGLPVVLSGVTGLVVVHANGRLLVMERARAADLKLILDRLPPNVRDL